MKIDIRNHRLNEVGLSMKGLAEQIGVTEDVVRNLEETGNRPLPQNAVKVAKYFGTTPQDLWPIKDDPPPVVVGRVRKP